MSSLMELLKNKKTALAANRRAKTVRPPDGNSRWRILPSWRKGDAPNAEQFWHDFGAHYIKDQTGELKAIYVCVDKTYGRPCSICSTVKQGIDSAADPEFKKFLEQARASGRILVNAVQVDGANPTDPVILEIGPTVFESIINIVSEWGADVLDLAKGRDITIERSGKGIGTKYSVQVSPKMTPLDAGIMAKVVNLDEYVAQENEEQALRALTNFRTVAGLLPGSSAPAALPSAAASLSAMRIDDGVDLDDEALRTLEGMSSTSSAESKSSVKSEPLSSDTTVSAGGAGSLDTSELDSLLAELNGTTD